MKISNWNPLGRPVNTSLWPAGAVTTGPGPGGTGTPVTVADLQVTVDDEGTPLATAATSLNFVGAGVTASGTGAVKTVTVPGGGAPSGTASGDLSGSYPGPTVAKINGVAVTGTPSVGMVPTATSPTAATWQAPSGSSTHLEVVMSSGSLTPPDPILSSDGLDWVYGAFA